MFNINSRVLKSYVNLQTAFMELFNRGIGYEEYVQASETTAKTFLTSHEAATQILQEYDQEYLEFLNYKIKLLVIAAPWCSDCKKAVPILSVLQEYFTEWEIKIVLRDDFREIVDQFYTTSGRAKIPLFVFADEDGNEVARWAERPKISYLKTFELQAKRLKKEEYIAEYRSMPELKPPVVTKNIINEVLDIAEKTISMLKILPKQR